MYHLISLTIRKPFYNMYCYSTTKCGVHSHDWIYEYHCLSADVSWLQAALITLSGGGYMHSELHANTHIQHTAWHLRLMRVMFRFGFVCVCEKSEGERLGTLLKILQ